MQSLGIHLQSIELKCWGKFCGVKWQFVDTEFYTEACNLLSEIMTFKIYSQNKLLVDLQKLDKSSSLTKVLHTLIANSPPSSLLLIQKSFPPCSQLLPDIPLRFVCLQPLFGYKSISKWAVRCKQRKLSFRLSCGEKSKLQKVAGDVNVNSSGSKKNLTSLWRWIVFRVAFGTALWWNCNLQQAGVGWHVLGTELLSLMSSTRLELADWNEFLFAGNWAFLAFNLIIFLRKQLFIRWN